MTMPFKKGHKINLGKPRTEDVKNRIRLGNIGKKRPYVSLIKKGVPLTAEHKQALKENHKGFTGRKHSASTKLKLSVTRRGEKGTNWKGGISSVNELVRKSSEYKIWREAVFVRDDWTCVWCKVKGVALHADHIKPFAYFPELRFAIDNGRTLCVDCHKTTETYGGRSKNNNTIYDNN